MRTSDPRHRLAQERRGGWLHRRRMRRAGYRWQPILVIDQAKINPSTGGFTIVKSHRQHRWINQAQRDAGST